MRRNALLPTLLLAVLVAAGCGSGDDGSGESGQEPATPSSTTSSTTSSADEPSAESPADGGSVTALTVDGGAQTGRCAVPTPHLVQGNDLAFDGVVESVADDGLVTLRPTAFYAGEPTDVVTVQEPGADLQALLAAVDFREGERYLVAASGGRVALCTISAAWTPQLAATYEEAFGAPR